jgi:L-asparagine transporter-like permease
MKINKDLMNAVLMVSFIVLVLVGTTTFTDEMTKIITMVSLGALCLLSIVFLVIASKKGDKKPS